MTSTSLRTSPTLGPAPHYVTTRYGQLRVWRAGSGADLVVLPGLVTAASVRSAEMADRYPSWTSTVVELPGIGGSAGVDPGDLAVAAKAIAAALAELGISRYALLAFDLCAALAAPLARDAGARPSAVVFADTELAAGWIGGARALPPIEPRADGTHLPALWTHFRNCHLLDAEGRRVAGSGHPLPADAELDAAVVSAAVAPDRYAAMWMRCASKWPDLGRATPIDGIETIVADGPLDPALARAAQSVAAARSSRTPAAAAPCGEIWCDYVDTPGGRVHLRRAGREGRPLLALHSAPGSSAPLAPLVRGLASQRRVFAPDYLGNGDSDKPPRRTDIAGYACAALEVADALGLDTFDLWGTHTGALIALELAIRFPERVGRAVLEAPPLLQPDFAADILANYLPALELDRWGLHLLRAWNMRRDMFLFWPWYRQARGAARRIGVPDLATIHDWTIGLLKSGVTYDWSYRAAFEYDTWARLPLLTRPALLCAGPADMLVDALEAARKIVAAGTVVAPTPATVWYPAQPAHAVAESLRIYDDFLRGG